MIFTKKALLMISVDSPFHGLSFGCFFFVACSVETAKHSNSAVSIVAIASVAAVAIATIALVASDGTAATISSIDAATVLNASVIGRALELAGLNVAPDIVVALFFVVEPATLVAVGARALGVSVSSVSATVATVAEVISTVSSVEHASVVIRDVAAMASKSVGLVVSLLDAAGVEVVEVHVPDAAVVVIHSTTTAIASVGSIAVLTVPESTVPDLWSVTIVLNFAFHVHIGHVDLKILVFILIIHVHLNVELVISVVHVDFEVGHIIVVIAAAVAETVAHTVADNVLGVEAVGGCVAILPESLVAALPLGKSPSVRRRGLSGAVSGASGSPKAWH